MSYREEILGTSDGLYRMELVRWYDDNHPDGVTESRYILIEEADGE